MKIKLLVWICFFTSIGLLSCNKIDFVEVQNNEAYVVKEKLVYLSRNDLNTAGEGYLQFQNEKGNQIPSQFEDTDHDGNWDKVSLLVSLPANGKIKVTYRPTEEMENVTARTQAYLGLSEKRDGTFISAKGHVRPEDHEPQSKPYIYQYEGPGWESDKVAFRTYFDSRNGKDIFGKMTSEMVTDNIGLKESYHELQDWGMDILKVNNSLGAGALAMLKGDSLYRLGDTERAEAKILMNGPLTAKWLLDYDGWQVDEKNYNVEEQVSIHAGQRWYESKVTLEGGTVKDTLVTGIVNLHDIPSEKFEYKDFQIIYSHGKQSFIKDNLGMAVIVPAKYYAGFAEAPEEGLGVTQTHTAYLTQAEGIYHYYFYVGWEKEDNGFKQKDYFVEQIKTAIDQIVADINVNYKQ